MNNKIAKIMFDSRTKYIVDIIFLRKDLRFKCKRCGVFCCKLGGPWLTEKDKERFKKAGYRMKDFLDYSLEDEIKQWRCRKPVLKQKEDGSCIFLQSNGKETYKCSIYELRPALCTLYPFNFEPTGHNTGILRFIPCCRGLNAHDGSLVDKGFVEKELLESILDLHQGERLMWEKLESQEHPS